MAWWQDRNRVGNDGLPKELEGKTPEEIAQALREATKVSDDLKASQTKLTELQSQFDTQKGQLDTQTNQFNEMKTRLEQLEANGSGQQQQQQQQDEPPSVWNDPGGFVRNETKPIADVAYTSGLLSARMYFEQQLSERDRKIFKKYEKEVLQGLETFPPAARVNPQSWFNVFMFQKGLHESDIKKAESEKTDFFSETASRGNGQQPEDDNEIKLSSAEEETCKAMKWDPKKYLEQKKGLALSQSERGSYATFKVPMREARGA